MSHQEEILNSMLDTMSAGSQYSNHAIIEVMRDCFSISRIQNEIRAFSGSAAFNQVIRERIVELSSELDAILLKYKIQ